MYNLVQSLNASGQAAPYRQRHNAAPASHRNLPRKRAKSQCEWPNDDRCCKQGCCTKWEPAHIQLFRERGAPWVETRNSEEDDEHSGEGDEVSLAHNRRVNRKTWASSRMVVKEGKEGSERYDYYLDAPNVCSLQDYRSPLDLQLRNGVKVCRKFFTWAGGLSNKFVSEVHVLPKSRDSGPRRVRSKEAIIVSWLLDLKASYEQSPDSDLTFLPFVNRRTVLGLLEDEVERCRPRPGKSMYSYFCKVWRGNETTNKLKLRKHLRFAKCNDCVEFRERRADTRDPREIAGIQQQVAAHHREVKQERSAYYERQALAENHPESYLSIICDGADQSDHTIPHFRERTHDTMNLWGIHVHLLGILSHGRQPQAVTFLPNVKQGTNVTIECLHQYIYGILLAKGKLPKTLLLQLDNTSKQCKSRFLFGFLGYLVHLGVFKEAIVSFLPVGHVRRRVCRCYSCFIKVI